MIDKVNFTNVGSCVKMHGTKGEFVFRLKPGISPESLKGTFLFIDLDGGLVPFKVRTMRLKNDTDVLISLEDAEGESVIQRLINAPVFIESRDLVVAHGKKTGDDSHVGWLAVDTKKGNLGRIEEVIEISKNPLYVVDYNNSELLIPINDDLIDSVDENSNTIFFSLPEGMLELND